MKSSPVAPRSTPADVLERKTIPLSSIVPSKLNPRAAVGNVDDLAASIAEVGLLQPLVVTPLEDGGYELVAGERRYTALKKNKATEVDVTVRDIEADVDIVLAAFAENTMREDLTPLDEARGYRQLIDTFGLKQDAVAKRLRVSPAHVSKRLSLLTLPGDVQKQVSAGKLGATDAYDLSRLVGKVPDAPKAIATIMRDARDDGDVAWMVDEAVDDHQRKALAAAVAQKFRDDGVLVLTDAEANKHRRVKSAGLAYGSDLELDVKKHAKEPCRAITVHPGHKDPAVTEYCTDPARHAKTKSRTSPTQGTSDLKASAPARGTTTTKKERDRRAAEREANKARREFMAALITDEKRVPAPVIDLLALRRYATSGWSVEARAACELLDLEPIKSRYGNTKDWPGTLAKHLAGADESTLRRAALAKILAEGETRHERAADHRAFLLDVGYEPTDWERREWKVKKPDPLTDAHIAARAVADDYANECGRHGIDPGSRFHELDAELREGATAERVAAIREELEAIVLEHLDDAGDVTIGEPEPEGAAAGDVDDELRHAADQGDSVAIAELEAQAEDDALALDTGALDTATLAEPEPCPFPQCRLAAEHEGEHEPFLTDYAYPPIRKQEEFLREDIAKLEPTVPAVVALQQELYAGVTIQRIPAMAKEIKALAENHARSF